MATILRRFSHQRLSSLVVLVCVMSVSLNIFFVYSTRHHGRKVIVHNDVSDADNAPSDDRDDGKDHIAHHPDVRSLRERESKEQEFYHLDHDVMSYKERHLPDKERSMPDPRVGDVKLEHSQEAENVKDKSDKATAHDAIATLHPCMPDGLEGPLKAVTTDIGPEEILNVFSTSLEKGGRLRPKDCLASERLAIIFPYRNRWPHLHIALFNLIPLLIRQKVDATFFVIQQANTATFNRGALLNIGFLEAEKIDPFDCYIFHDVDLIPLNDNNTYRCGDRPHHFAAAINSHGFRLMYDTFFGGVIGFSKKQYRLVNGNSNIYFGWGGEDDDLWLRVHNKNMTVARYDAVTSRYFMIKHTRDKGNEKNIERKRILKTAIRRQDVEGLNTSTYDVLSIEVKQLYTWIQVSLDLLTVINTAPSYTRHDIWKMVKMFRIQQRELQKKRLVEALDGKDKEH